eukprot:3380566-Amphidinium_carterae.2
MALHPAACNCAWSKRGNACKRAHCNDFRKPKAVGRGAVTVVDPSRCDWRHFVLPNICSMRI